MNARHRSATCSVWNANRPYYEPAAAAPYIDSLLTRLAPRALPHSARMHTPDPPASARVKFGNVSLLVYSGDDIVSQALRGPQHTWETHVSAGRDACDHRDCRGLS